MTALAVMAALVVVGLLAAGAMVLWVVLHAIVWLVLLPFRLVIALVAWPLALVKGVVALVVGAVLLVVGVVAAMAVAVSLFVALLVPLLPLAILALALWALVRLARRPAVATP